MWRVTSSQTNSQFFSFNAVRPYRALCASIIVNVHIIQYIQYNVYSSTLSLPLLLLYSKSHVYKSHKTLFPPTVFGRFSCMSATAAARSFVMRCTHNKCIRRAARPVPVSGRACNPILPSSIRTSGVWGSDGVDFRARRGGERRRKIHGEKKISPTS